MAIREGEEAQPGWKLDRSRGLVPEGDRDRARGTEPKRSKISAGAQKPDLVQ